MIIVQDILIVQWWFSITEIIKSALTELFFQFKKKCLDKKHITNEQQSHIQIYKSSPCTKKECQKYFHLYQFPNYSPPPHTPLSMNSSLYMIPSFANSFFGQRTFFVLLVHHEKLKSVFVNSNVQNIHSNHWLVVCVMDFFPILLKKFGKMFKINNRSVQNKRTGKKFGPEKKIVQYLIRIMRRGNLPEKK